MTHAVPPRPDIGLVDCGDGRRLDRLGPYLVDRPAPAARWIAPRDPGAWASADARYERAERGRGRWVAPNMPAPGWRVDIGALSFELRLGDGGQVGVFLEQAPMWAWVGEVVRSVPDARVLNLFAYTGGTTLAAAAAGASVVHVDGSRTAAAWARRNADLSGLDAAPIRWIVDDAEAFVGRELRRGNRYDLVVLDPPSFGHGRRGERWRLEERLPDLLAGCVGLRAPVGGILVTAHTPGYGSDRLAAEVEAALARGRAAEGAAGRIQAGPLDLRAESGALLPAGAYARRAPGRTRRRGTSADPGSGAEPSIRDDGRIPVGGAGAPGTALDARPS